MNICVIGCGYVGMSSALAIARYTKVSIWDKDSTKLHQLQENCMILDEEEMKLAFFKNRHNIVLEKSEEDVIKHNDSNFAHRF